jgi:hypothetical protein
MKRWIIRLMTVASVLSVAGQAKAQEITPVRQFGADFAAELYRQGYGQYAVPDMVSVAIDKGRKICEALDAGVSFEHIVQLDEQAVQKSDSPDGLAVLLLAADAAGIKNFCPHHLPQMAAWVRNNPPAQPTSSTWQEQLVPGMRQNNPPNRSTLPATY